MDRRLDTAIYRKDYRAIQALLKEGIDINATDKGGLTALMIAILAEDADPATVEFLIARGADVNVRDRAQRLTALHFAARDQKLAIVRVLLAHGAEVDPQDIFGDTPLWRCVMNSSRNIEIVKELLAKGADPNKKNKSGVSAIDIAVKFGEEDVAAILRK